jgi:hypothetical protein
MRLVLAVVAMLLVAPALAQNPYTPYEVITADGARKTVYPDWRTVNLNPLGDELNPVRVLRADDMRGYLARLVCPEGGAPVYRPIPIHMRGPYGNMLYAWIVTCANTARRVHFDVGHPDYVEKRSVPGFKIRDL